MESTYMLDTFVMMRYLSTEWLFDCIGGITTIGRGGETFIVCRGRPTKRSSRRASWLVLVLSLFLSMVPWGNSTSLLIWRRRKSAFFAGSHTLCFLTERLVYGWY